MLSFIGFLICAILVFYVIRGISDLSNTASESRKLKKDVLCRVSVYCNAFKGKMCSYL